MLKNKRLQNLPLKAYLFCFLICFFGNAESKIFGKEDRFMENWRKAFVECVRIEALSPNIMVRNMTIFSISVHDALNSADKRYETLFNHQSAKIGFINPEAIIAGCGWTVSRALHPNRQVAFKRLSSFARKEDANQSVKSSFLHGKRVAEKVLHNRQNDGSSTTISYLATDSPGQWRRTPKFYRPPEQPHWRKVRLWALPGKQSFLPPPPPSFDSTAYASSVSEAKTMGGKFSQLRSPEESFIAKFWKDFSYSQTPPGHWNEIAAFVSHASKLDLWEEARLFALLNLAMTDAGIISWQAKYHYHLWRPIDAIRNADEFASTRNLVNKSWSPLLETPPHPEYPSAHSCFSGAASHIMQLFFQSDRFSFRVSSDQYPGKYRRFESFSQCASEIGKSRLYGGIHYSFSNLNGIQCGKKIGSFIYANLLKSLQRK